MESYYEELGHLYLSILVVWMPATNSTMLFVLSTTQYVSSLLYQTSVDAKHHGASLSQRWNVTWVGNNSICTH